MSNNAGTIFRAEALQHFVEGRERSVLPRFIRPRTFLCLWILLGLFLSALFMTWTTRVPSYVAALSIVSTTDGKPVLYVLVPAEHSIDLAVGQQIWVRRPESRVVSRTQIVRVEPQILSPAVVRKRFDLSTELIHLPIVVVIANVDEILLAANDPLLEAYMGSTAPVDVEIGSRRVLSLLSGISGNFLSND